MFRTRHAVSIQHLRMCCPRHCRCPSAFGESSSLRAVFLQLGQFAPEGTFSNVWRRSVVVAGAEQYLAPSGRGQGAAELPVVARTERSGPKCQRCRVEKLQEEGVTGRGRKEGNKLYFFRLLSFTACSVIFFALRELRF